MARQTTWARMRRAYCAPLLLVSALVASCASTPLKPTELSVDQKIRNALAADDCGVSQSLPETFTFRQVFGLPFCRENHRSDNFRTDLRVAPGIGLAMTGEHRQCGSYLRNVNRTEFDEALTRVMTDDDFLEAEVLYILSCSTRTCNGIERCEGTPARREFYRPADGVSVTAYYGNRDYPRTPALYIKHHADESYPHPCAKPEGKGHCFPPGKLPR